MQNRPLTAEERLLLERLLPARLGGGAGFAALITFIVTLGVLLIVLPGSWSMGLRSLLPALGAGGLAAFAALRVSRAPWRREWRERVERDLAADVVVTTYQAQAALAVEEAEDEGAQYYLQLRDGRVVFLSGQYLYELEDGEQLRGSTIRIERAPHTATVLSLQHEGPPLPIRARRAPFDEAEHRERRVPEDGAVVDVAFETLLSEAQRAPSM